MALNADQLQQLEYNNAVEAQQRQQQIDMENLRHVNSITLDKRRTRLEALRMARETLIENRRNLPADQREVVAADIVNFANALVNYVDT